jgi:hypothetical protein
MTVSKDYVASTLMRFDVLFKLPADTDAQQLIDIWYGLFKDMDEVVFKEACRECALRLEYFPRPADVMRFADQL